MDSPYRPPISFPYPHHHFSICAHYSTTVLFHTTHTWLCCRLLETQENATTPHLKLYNALHLGSLESKAPYQSNTFLTHMNLDNTCSFELSFGLTGHIMENSMVINHEIQCKSSTRKSKHWWKHPIRFILVLSTHNPWCPHLTFHILSPAWSFRMTSKIYTIKRTFQIISALLLSYYFHHKYIY